MFTDKDGISIAIAVLVLVIGTATGNAYAMLGLALAGLILLAVLYGAPSKQLASLAVLSAGVAAVVAGILTSVR